MKSHLKKLVAIVFAALLVAGCAEDQRTLKVGAKPFSESMLLAEMIAQVAENEGIPVERQIPYGVTQKIMEATKQGIIDIYPEYNGTSLIFLGQAPTSDGDASTEKVRALFQPLGLDMGGKFGFSNDYVMVMTAERAQALGVSSIGDLADLSSPPVFAIDDDFTQRPADGYQQLLRRYGISAGDPLEFPVGTEGKDRIVSALLDGSADVAELFATDGQIAEYNLVTLEDNLGFFPVYEAMPLVRSDALEGIPGLKGVLDKLSGAISAADMQALNKSVDLDAQTPATVAAAFLSSKGLLPEDAAGSAVESVAVAAGPEVSRSSSSARALRAIRAGFAGNDLELVNSTDPLDTLAASEARVAMVGAESFYRLTDDGPAVRDDAEAFAVLGYRTAHLLASSAVGASITNMKSIATGPEGSGSARVLEMMLASMDLADQVSVSYSDAPLSEQVTALNQGQVDGVFALEPQGSRAIGDALRGGARLVSIDEWAEGGHAARFSFIRPTSIAADTYPFQVLAVDSVSTQYVLASPVRKAQAAGEVGPGTAGVTTVVPVSGDAVNAIRESLDSGDVVDPAIPVHAALVPEIEVVDKALPFSLDISIINILVILFIVWAIYACTLPSPRDVTMPEDH